MKRSQEQRTVQQQVHTIQSKVMEVTQRLQPVMQEHHSLIKRANAWSRERQLDKPTNFFLNFTLIFVAPNINELM
jgi:hypothetical protein